MKTEKKISLISLLIAVFALSLSFLSFYFQYFHSKDKLVASIQGFSSEGQYHDGEEKKYTVITLAIINHGNRNALISDCRGGEFFRTDSSVGEIPSFRYLTEPYVSLPIVLEPADIFYAKIKIPLYTQEYSTPEEIETAQEEASKSGYGVCYEVMDSKGKAKCVTVPLIKTEVTNEGEVIYNTVEEHLFVDLFVPEQNIYWFNSYQG